MNQITKTATVTICKTYEHPAYGQLFEAFTSGLSGQYVAASPRCQVDEFVNRIMVDYVEQPHWVIKSGERIPVIYQIEVVEI